MSESPGVRAAMWLLDTARAQGFRFERIAPGPDGPLRGVRETAQSRLSAPFPGSRRPVGSTIRARRAFTVGRSHIDGS
ncbi:MAG TPA: hypothetical protein VFO16_19155 [Pseudonocardiaceae bacterium]|nr:hypothetical protein [Pseudonocardiaceae bacterium]